MTMTLAERGVQRAGELPLVVAVGARFGGRARRACNPATRSLRVNGRMPRDIIEWQLLVDEAELALEVLAGRRRAGGRGRPSAAASRSVPRSSSAVFDRVRTCDNHCEFCFIYQLPKGMRRSLYLKDDDYRLSFLYGNFTTLTRFTESDLERVITQRLSPLHVSIHATDPRMRERMLRNKRGGMSLRWLRALLDHGIDVHGQVVVCPGLNDGDVLEDTMAGVLDRFPDLASVAVVPLGVSRYNGEDAMRPHTTGRGRGGRRHGRAVAGDLPRCPRSPDGAPRRRVLPAGRPPVPRCRRVRRVPDARGRHRHGTRVRARVRRALGDADRPAERVLRRGRRRACQRDTARRARTARS